MKRDKWIHATSIVCLLQFFYVRVCGIVPGYITSTQPDVIPGDFYDTFVDEDITSGITTQGTLLDPNQYIIVDFGEVRDFKTIYIHTDESTWTSGSVIIEIDEQVALEIGGIPVPWDIGTSQTCYTSVNNQLGVFECGSVISGQRLRIYCLTGCESNLAVTMIKAYSEQSFSLSTSVTQMAAFTGNSISDTQAFQNLIGIGSQISALGTNAVQLNSVGDYIVGFGMDFSTFNQFDDGSYEPLYITKVLILTEDSGQDSFKLSYSDSRIYEEEADFVSQCSYTDPGLTDFKSIEFTCETEANAIAIWRDGYTVMDLNKVVILGERCSLLSPSWTTTTGTPLNISDPDETYSITLPGLNNFCYSVAVLQLYYLDSEKQTDASLTYSADFNTNTLYLQPDSDFYEFADQNNGVEIFVDIFMDFYGKLGFTIFPSNELSFIVTVLKCTTEEITIKDTVLLSSEKLDFEYELWGLESEFDGLPTFEQIGCYNPGVFAFDINTEDGTEFETPWFSYDYWTHKVLFQTDIDFMLYYANQKFSLILDVFDSLTGNSNNQVRLNVTIAPYISNFVNAEIEYKGGETLFPTNIVFEVDKDFNFEAAQVYQLKEFINTGTEANLIASGTDKYPCGEIVFQLTDELGVLIFDNSTQTIKYNPAAQWNRQTTKDLTGVITAYVSDDQNPYMEDLVLPFYYDIILVGDGCEITDLETTNGVVDFIEPEIELKPQDSKEIKLTYLWPFPLCGILNQLNVTYGLSGFVNTKELSIVYDSLSHKLDITSNYEGTTPLSATSCMNSRIHNGDNIVTRQDCFQIIVIPVELPGEINPDINIPDIASFDESIAPLSNQTLSPSEIDQDQLSQTFLNFAKNNFPGLLPPEANQFSESLSAWVSQKDATGSMLLQFNMELIDLGDFNEKTITMQFNEDQSNQPGLDANLRTLQSQNEANQAFSKPWMEITINSGDQSLISPEMLGVKYSGKFIDQYTVQIQLEFDTPEYVSLTSEKEIAVIKLWGPFMAIKDNVIFRLPSEGMEITTVLPCQSSNPEKVELIQEVTEEVASISLATIFFKALANLYQKGALSEILGMIASMQLIVNTALFNLSIPGNALALFEFLVPLATYEYIPTDDLFPLFIDLPEGEAFNDRFDFLDYGTMYTIMNMGNLTLIFVWILLLLFVYFILVVISLISKGCASQKIDKYRTKLSKILFWNSFIHYLQGTILDIFLIVFLSLLTIGDDSETSVKSETTSQFFWLSLDYAYTFILIAMMAGYFLLIAYYLWKKNDLYEDEAFKEKYEAAYEELSLSKENRLPLISLIYDFLRRLLFALTVVFWNDYAGLQVMLFIYATLVSILLHLNIWSLKGRFENQFFIYDQATITFLGYLLLNCTDMFTHVLGRERVGDLIVFTVIQNVICQLIRQLRRLLRFIYRWLKKQYYILKSIKGKGQRSRYCRVKCGWCTRKMIYRCCNKQRYKMFLDIEKQLEEENDLRKLLELNKSKAVQDLSKRELLKVEEASELKDESEVQCQQEGQNHSSNELVDFEDPQINSVQEQTLREEKVQNVIGISTDIPLPKKFHKLQNVVEKKTEQDKSEKHQEINLKSDLSQTKRQSPQDESTTLNKLPEVNKDGPLIDLDELNLIEKAYQLDEQQKKEISLVADFFMISKQKSQKIHKQSTQPKINDLKLSEDGKSNYDELSDQQNSFKEKPSMSSRVENHVKDEKSQVDSQRRSSVRKNQKLLSQNNLTHVALFPELRQNENQQSVQKISFDTRQEIENNNNFINLINLRPQSVNSEQLLQNDRSAIEEDSVSQYSSPSRRMQIRVEKLESSPSPVKIRARSPNKKGGKFSFQLGELKLMRLSGSSFNSRKTMQRDCCDSISQNSKNSQRSNVYSPRNVPFLKNKEGKAGIGYSNHDILDQDSTQKQERIELLSKKSNSKLNIFAPPLHLPPLKKLSDCKISSKICTPKAQNNNLFQGELLFPVADSGSQRKESTPRDDLSQASSKHLGPPLMRKKNKQFIKTWTPQNIHQFRLNGFPSPSFLELTETNQKSDHQNAMDFIT